jgi:precorrin-2 dehydrogenase/sirohydrochlorin ferrochelatase
MRYYPVHLDVSGRSCLVVGGGAVGARKAGTLCDCGAAVTVVSPEATEALRRLAEGGRIELRQRDYASEDLAGMFLVIGATDDEELNRRISRDAESRRILCNIADRPEACSFILPSIVTQGDLVLTISTAGKSPALAKRLRQELERQFGVEYAVLLELMGAIRRRLLARAHAPEAHKPLFESILDSGVLELIRQGKRPEIDRLLTELLGEGFVFEELIGPGKPPTRS